MFVVYLKKSKSRFFVAFFQNETQNLLVLNDKHKYVYTHYTHVDKLENILFFKWGLFARHRTHFLALKSISINFDTNTRTNEMMKNKSFFDRHCSLPITVLCFYFGTNFLLITFCQLLTIFNL